MYNIQISGDLKSKDVKKSIQRKVKKEREKKRRNIRGKQEAQNKW